MLIISLKEIAYLIINPYLLFNRLISIRLTIIIKKNYFYKVITLALNILINLSFIYNNDI